MCFQLTSIKFSNFSIPDSVRHRNSVIGEMFKEIAAVNLSELKEHNLNLEHTRQLYCLCASTWPS